MKDGLPRQVTDFSAFADRDDHFREGSLELVISNSLPLASKTTSRGHITSHLNLSHGLVLALP